MNNGGEKKGILGINVSNKQDKFSLQLNFSTTFCC